MSVYAVSLKDVDYMMPVGALFDHTGSYVCALFIFVQQCAPEPVYNCVKLISLSEIFKSLRSNEDGTRKYLVARNSKTDEIECECAHDMFYYDTQTGSLHFPQGIMCINSFKPVTQHIFTRNCPGEAVGAEVEKELQFVYNMTMGDIEYHAYFRDERAVNTCDTPLCKEITSDKIGLANIRNDMGLAQMIKSRADFMGIPSGGFEVKEYASFLHFTFNSKESVNLPYSTNSLYSICLNCDHLPVDEETMKLVEMPTNALKANLIGGNVTFSTLSSDLSPYLFDYYRRLPLRRLCMSGVEVFDRDPDNLFYAFNAVETELTAYFKQDTVMKRQYIFRSEPTQDNPVAERKLTIDFGDIFHQGYWDIPHVILQGPKTVLAFGTERRVQQLEMCTNERVFIHAKGLEENLHISDLDPQSLLDELYITPSFDAIRTTSGDVTLTVDFRNIEFVREKCPKAEFQAYIEEMTVESRVLTLTVHSYIDEYVVYEIQKLNLPDPELDTFYINTEGNIDVHIANVYCASEKTANAVLDVARAKKMWGTYVYVNNVLYMNAVVADSLNYKSEFDRKAKR